MKFIRPLSLSLALGLLLPGLVLAQSLPPMNPDYSGQYSYPQNQPSYSQYNQPSYSNYGGYQQAPLQGHVVTAPQGTVVPVTLPMTISSETARVGDRVVVNLGAPIAAGGSILLPAGSQVEGQVVMVDKASRGFGDNGELDIRFMSAVLPNGQRVPISARIQTEDGTGILRGGTTKGRVGKTVVKTGVGAGIGALSGLVAAAMSGGDKSRATALMVPVGAGAGLVAAGADRGEDVILNAGQPINIVLDSPLTSSPYNDYGYQQSGQGYYQQPAPTYQPYNQPYNNSGYPQQNYQSNPQPVPFYGQ